MLRTEPTTPVAGPSAIWLVDMPVASRKGRGKEWIDLPAASRKGKEQADPLTTSRKGKGKQWADPPISTKSIKAILSQAMVGLNQQLNCINRGTQVVLEEMRSGFVLAEETRFTEMKKMLWQYNRMLQALDKHMDIIDMSVVGMTSDLNRTKKTVEAHAGHLMQNKVDIVALQGMANNLQNQLQISFSPSNQPPAPAALHLCQLLPKHPLLRQKSSTMMRLPSPRRMRARWTAPLL
ncbi:hypothetical protein C0989_000795 [Termitomyces sp. Mn162]|nr:hypothetical protein C0989_000795 [Termitomyces sp. Mn162]